MSTPMKQCRVSMSMGVLWLAASMSFAAETGAEAILPATPNAAHRPHVSYGNGQYLVVWQSGLAENADIYGCRLSADGKPIDKDPFIICKAVECQEYPRAAWGKDSWLVVWSDLRNDKDFDVYAARVSADGKVLNPDGVLLAGGEHNQCKPDVAWSGEAWLVAWRSYQKDRYGADGARVTSDGKTLDAKPIEVARIKLSSSVSEPRVVATSNGWMVAWTGNRLGTTGPNEWFYRGISTTHVTPDGQVTTVDTLNGFFPLSPITVASNGKDECLIVWGNHVTGGRSHPNEMDHALRADAKGKNLGALTLGPKKSVSIWYPSAAWDGKGYLVACWNGETAGNGRPAVSGVLGHWVADDGKYEGVVEISSGTPNPAYLPAAAGDGKGHTLVVYERHPEKAGDTVLIAVRLLSR